MKKRLGYLSSCLALLVLAAFAGASFSASSAAAQQTCPNGDPVPPGLVRDFFCNLLPTSPAPPPPLPGPTTPAPAPAPVPAPAPAPGAPTTPTTPSEPAPRPRRNRGGGAEEPSGGNGGSDGSTDSKPRRRRGRDRGETTPEARVERQRRAGSPKRGPGGGGPLRNGDGSPAFSNPGAVTALPGSVSPFVSGVPNFVISKFRVPVFLLPIYQAAGIEYGVQWQVLAAINEIETDYGRNLNVSSAGALGWMQFIPSSWQAYGVDANKDGRKDPYNPVDAIFAAARYLKAAGYQDDVRGAIFAYNHAGWYVDSVMLRARLISGVPSDLVGSLTGLTEGRFPVAAKARYADDLQEAATRKVAAGQNAANIVESDDSRRSIEIYAKEGSPAVATQDGKITKIAKNDALGRYVQLQDVYGNTYTYSHLKNTARFYPVPKDDGGEDPAQSANALAANAKGDDPAPPTPASAGRQPAEAEAEADGRKNAKALDSAKAAPKGGKADRRAANKLEKPANPGAQAATATKQRLFAHPGMGGAREAGGLQQILDAKVAGGKGLETYRNRFARPFGTDAEDVRLKPLRKGAQVIGGTVLGRVGATVQGKGSHLGFAIRPAGEGAPTIDPKPILDGWKLLEATAIYRASGRNVLHGGEGSGFSVGQVLLLPKALLERRVLSDERIEIYAGGRADVQSGLIDRRVLATLAYLSESGMRPTVTSLRSGRSSIFTASGNRSAHPSGNAVDIAAINGTPILGNQGAGGVTEQAVRRIMLLQGTVAPDQIISLLDLGGATFALGDHADHIHVGFSPLFGTNDKLGRQAMAVLKPGQWSDLLDQLESIENPVVPTSPSKYSLPAKPASDAHDGE